MRSAQCADWCWRSLRQSWTFRRSTGPLPRWMRIAQRSSRLPSLRRAVTSGPWFPRLATLTSRKWSAWSIFTHDFSRVPGFERCEMRAEGTRGGPPRLLDRALGGVDQPVVGERLRRGGRGGRGRVTEGDAPVRERKIRAHGRRRTAPRRPADCRAPASERRSGRERSSGAGRRRCGAGSPRRGW